MSKGVFLYFLQIFLPSFLSIWNQINKMSSSFPILFGESSHGKRKMWSVAVEDRSGVGVLIVSHGYEGGKMVVNEREVTVGKNLGKKNETSPVQQATAEAAALWKKKQDARYVPAAAAGVVAAGGAGVVSSDDADSDPSNTGDIPLPMLAHDFNKRGKTITYPCFAQRKLDGVRCVAIAGKGLFSRNGKVFPHLEHIKTAINTLPVGTILDGELYSDSLTFQEIVGLVKKETHKAGDAAKIAQIHLCVYDTVRGEGYAARKMWLETLFCSLKTTALRLLPTAICASVDDIKSLHADYVAEGYEGLILRNSNGLYKIGHRSTDLQKYKEFFDAEYPVIGFKEGDGLDKGCVIWICKTPIGQEFAVRPRGTREDRSTSFTNGSKMLGKPLTVRYQELTTDGIPRFPVGIAFRTYE